MSISTGGPMLLPTPRSPKSLTFNRNACVVFSWTFKFRVAFRIASMFIGSIRDCLGKPNIESMLGRCHIQYNKVWLTYVAGPGLSRDDAHLSRGSNQVLRTSRVRASRSPNALSMKAGGDEWLNSDYEVVLSLDSNTVFEAILALKFVSWTDLRRIRTARGGCALISMGILSLLGKWQMRFSSDFVRGHCIRLSNAQLVRAFFYGMSTKPWCPVDEKFNQDSVVLEKLTSTVCFRAVD